MRFGFDEACLQHDPGVRHPENPDRLRAIREGLEDRENVRFEKPPPATDPAIRAVHDAGYLDELESFIEGGGGNWDPDTVATETTWEAALASAGLAVWAAATGLDASEGTNVPFALGRPPGHHATVDDAMGFCFLNNVAIATTHVLSEHDVSKVAILDWDVHHGNGTQDIFYDRGEVFYVSFHENGLYPGTGDYVEIGEGPGEGTTLNVPFPPGSGDADYLAVVDEVLVPTITDFDPGLLLVSAGFDAHRHDPISRMHLSTEGYGALTDRIWHLASAIDAGLGFVLEGGYSLETLSDGVGIVHDVLEGASVDPGDAGVSDEVLELIGDVARVHQISG